MRCTLRSSPFRPGLEAATRCVALGVLLLCTTLAGNAWGIVVEGTTAEFAWTPASGPVAGYRVFVIRNGVAGTAPEVEVSATTATIYSQLDDTIAVQVAAFDGAGNEGPLSPASESVTLTAPPPPPPPPYVVVEASGDFSLQQALDTAAPGEQVVVQLQGTTKQLLDAAPPGDLADGETWGLDQLIVGSPSQPTKVRLVDAVGLDLASPLADLPPITLAGLGNGAPCARDGGPGLIIAPGSQLVLGGIDLFVFDGETCVHLNERFPGPSDPNVIAYDGGEILLYGDLEDDGVLDPDDNCLIEVNPDQCDGDRDGFGNRCDFDSNGDNVVDLTDITAVMVAARKVSTSPVLDFNCDGAVGLDDFSLIMNRLDHFVGPSGLACTVDATCAGP